MDVKTLFIQKDPYEDYYIGPVIGKGAFSVVQECHKKQQPKMKYAVKVFDKSAFQQQEWLQVANEIAILKEIKHNNIISLEGLYETEQSLFIFMEYVSGGELFTEVGHFGPLSEACASRVVYQIADALLYLHSQSITHRDLKLENVLVCKDPCNGYLRVKLSDFGLSKKMALSSEEMMKTRCGTPAYAAPEILNGQEYTYKVDIWALGVIMFVMLYLKYPFTGDTLFEMYDNILAGKMDFPDESAKSSPQAQRLLGKLLEIDPQKRPSAGQVLEDEWVQKLP
jgi:serine/threonine protein kinase